MPHTRAKNKAGTTTAHSRLLGNVRSDGHEKSTEAMMMKSLFAGATALALIAAAAVAQQAYDSSTSRTTTVTTSVPAVMPVTPAVPAQTSTTTVERTVDPSYFDPTRTSSYHEEHVRTENGQTVEKSMKTETVSPSGPRTTTYSQTTTKTDGDD
jgi:hypothetical protein